MPSGLDPKPNFPTLEEAVLEQWEKEHIFEQTLTKPAPRGTFVFWEGPPTANGRPGLHHVLARTFKDLIPRFRTMQGYRVGRKAGWDTHGLPVELEVEKKLKISGKKAIENIVPGDARASISEFNRLCRESVWTYKEEWEKLTRRIGFWIDLSDPYVTYSPDYIDTVWWILSRIEARGLLYKDYKVLPYCPRCGTALSSHEVAQGYDEVSDRSVYVKFRLADRKDTYLLAWTTTSWTLPGNVALAINETETYVEARKQKAESRKQNIILAKKRLAVLGEEYEIIREFMGKELIGLHYEPLFQIPALQTKTAYQVYPASFVTMEDGTGIVHTAVMYGEDDFVLGTKLDLPKHHTVGPDGRFTEDVPEFTGQFVKDPETEEGIIRFLRKRNLLWREEAYTHIYPFCWRCQTPLLYYARDSWFIRMSQLRESLLARNQQINWVPAHIREGRMGEWLKEVKDWAISRDRYWGTPLPIWVCEKCQTHRVLSGLDELGLPPEKRQDFDPHRPDVDDVTLACSCGGTMRRVSEVLDVWFDSGAMPYAQWHWRGEGPIATTSQYPADYIAEAIDQTRGWFYTLLAVATLLEEDLPADRQTVPPYRNVICMGHLLDGEGQKMSKSRGNVINPWEVIDQYGVDGLRLHLLTMNQPGDPKRFVSEGVGETIRRSLLLLWNVTNYYLTYRSEQKTENKDQLRRQGVGVPTGASGKTEKLRPGQETMDTWLRARLYQVGQRITKALEAFDPFTAGRELLAAIDDLSTWYLRRSRSRSDDQFFHHLHEGLSHLFRWFAPFTPFLTDYLWQKIETQTPSVHLAAWPEVPSDWQDDKLLTEMDRLRRLVELGHAARNNLGIKLRQPLAAATVLGLTPLLKNLEAILAEELNVKAIYYQTGQELAVTLDATLTDALRREGWERELVRHIQTMRKDAHLAVGQEAVIGWQTDDADLAAILKNPAFQAGLSATTLSPTAHLTEASKTLDLQGKQVMLVIISQQ